ncbi:MAG: hypothetical protein OMOMHJEC_01595 [Xanthomonadales bacterium]|nr:hypothetical protein [Xanthomonadales bacterium]
MKNPNLSEKHYGNSTSFSLKQFRTELPKQTFNVSPSNAPTRGVRIDRLEGFSVPSFHARMIPLHGTGWQVSPN